MAEQTPRRAECPACHKSVALRKDGMLWHHTGNEPEWPGSPFKAFCPRRGLPPEPDAPSKRRRRPQPDWADLREMARNAGWTRRTLARDWFVWDDKESFVHIRRHPLGFLKISLGGGFGDVALNDPTPARVLNIARELGIGGAS